MEPNKNNSPQLKIEKENFAKTQRTSICMSEPLFNRALELSQRRFAHFNSYVCQLIYEDVQRSNLRFDPHIKIELNP